MPEIINAENYPSSNIVAQSYLDADALGSQATVVFGNPAEFAVDDFVLVGAKGAEQGQILRIQSITGQSVTFTTNLSVKHFRNEPVYKLRGNQIRFYRAANSNDLPPSDVLFAQIGVDTNIAADQLFTSYNDTTGGINYWYKYTFYNSVSTIETAIADAVPMRGGGFGHYATVDDVRKEAGLQNNPWIADSLIYSKLIAAESEVNGALLIAGYGLPFTTNAIPDAVVNATILLAAGYLLLTDYGPEHSGTNKDGNSKIATARKILADIGNQQIQLLDPITKKSVGAQKSVSGYPDDTSASLTPNEDSFFKITDRY